MNITDRKGNLYKHNTILRSEISCKWQCPNCYSEQTQVPVKSSEYVNGYYPYFVTCKQCNIDFRVIHDTK